MLDDQMVTKTKLKEFGWTDGLIAKHMPDACQLKTNPHYKSGPPMSLYSLARVESVVETLGLQAALDKTLEKRSGQSEVAKKVADVKRQTNLQIVKDFPLRLPNWDKQTLLEKACAHYNSRTDHRCEAQLTSDPTFLKRICCNYIRHIKTPYEGYLDRFFGLVGRLEMYETLKSNINSAVLDKWFQGGES